MCIAQTLIGNYLSTDHTIKIITAVHNGVKIRYNTVEGTEAICAF